jgi:hypothetical protein
MMMADAIERDLAATLKTVGLWQVSSIAGGDENEVALTAMPDDHGRRGGKRLSGDTENSVLVQ